MTLTILFFVLKHGVNDASLADYAGKKIFTFLSLESLQGSFPPSSSSHRIYASVRFETLRTIGKH